MAGGKRGGGAHAWQGDVCMAGGMYGGGVHA